MKSFARFAFQLAGCSLALAVSAGAATARMPQERLAQSDKPLQPAPPVISKAIQDDRHSRVHWDTDEHGTIWVRGRGYKASFGADGATFFPLFGSKQPRHFPLALSLNSATSGGEPIALEPVVGAVRDGERVIIERGVIDEVYEIRLDGVEQTFVVEGRPQADLQLSVGLESEMLRTERADGILLSNEFGTMHYGRAFAREPGGAKHALGMELVDCGVEIAVEANYLAAAQFPLVIDPLVTVFFVDTSSFADTLPDVAYDATTDRFLYVYEEQATAGDRDVYSILVSATGAVISGGYVDSTTDSWMDPCVANLNAYDQFLVAAGVFDGTPAPGTSANTCRGRQTSAASLAYGPVLTIASDALGSSWVSVGGDPYPFAPSYYCATWTRTGPPGPMMREMRARLVTNTGALVGAGDIILLGPTPDNVVGPRVSKGNGGTMWNIAWRHHEYHPFDRVYATQVMWDGSSATPAFLVASGIGFPLDYGPVTVSSPNANGQYLVAWDDHLTTAAPNPENYAALITGSTVHGVVSLTDMTPGGPASQSRPNVDCDGEQFAVAYLGNDSATYVSSFHVLANALGVTEAHVPFNVFGAGQSQHPCIVSKYSTGGVSKRYAVGWQGFATGQPDGNIYGGFYDGLQGGPISTACFGDGSGTACPCANSGLAGRGCGNSANASGAQLLGSGQADLSNDTVVLSANGVTPGAPCLFFQGTSLFSGGNGIPFGDGLLCAGGTITRFAVKFAVGTSASYPVGADPDLSIAGAVPPAGALRYYQVWYRDAAVFCSSSTFNLTNAVSVTWLP